MQPRAPCARMANYLTTGQAGKSLRSFPGSMPCFCGLTSHAVPMRFFLAQSGGAIFCATLAVAADLPAPKAESIAVEIARDEQRVKERPDDLIAQTRLGFAHVRRARETGDLGAYKPAEVAFGAALARMHSRSSGRARGFGLGANGVASLCGSS